MAEGLYWIIRAALLLILSRCFVETVDTTPSEPNDYPTQLEPDANPSPIGGHVKSLSLCQGPINYSGRNIDFNYSNKLYNHY